MYGGFPVMTDHSAVVDLPRTLHLRPHCPHTYPTTLIRSGRYGPTLIGRCCYIAPRYTIYTGYVIYWPLPQFSR